LSGNEDFEGRIAWTTERALTQGVDRVGEDHKARGQDGLGCGVEVWSAWLLEEICVTADQVVDFGLIEAACPTMSTIPARPAGLWESQDRRNSGEEASKDC